MSSLSEDIARFTAEADAAYRCKSCSAEFESVRAAEFCCQMDDN